MRKRWIRILTVVAVILVVLGVVYAILLARATLKLRRAYAALAAEGRPMRPAEVIPPEVADTENAALLYRSAISLLKAEPVGHRLETRPGESVKEAIDRERHNDVLGYLASLSAEFAQGTLSPERLAELNELMGRQSVEYALFAVERGTQRLAYWQECNYDAGMNLVMPELDGVRSLARVIGAKARLEAQAGARERAWQLAAMQAKLAEAYRAEPILIPQLVRVAIIRISCETIRSLCETAPPGAEQGEQLEAMLIAFDDVTPLVRAVDGERLLCGEWLFTRSKKELYKVLRDLGTPDFMFWLPVQVRTCKPLFLADHADYLRIMQAHARSLEGPYEPEAPEEYRRFSLTGMLVPAIGRVRTIHCEMLAENRITRAGLALLRHRAAHGTFPASLEALGRDGLSDPFLSGPLHYRAEGEGFVLYSVGENLKDDGGVAKPKRRTRGPRKPEEYDIVWRFPAGQTP